jgi:hypothetical protein
MASQPSDPRLGPAMLAVNVVAGAGWLALTYRFLWREGPLLLFVIFFAVGAVWLLSAIYYSIERLKYGVAELDVTGPVRTGGKLAGVLRVPAGFGGAAELTATLRCLRITFLEGIGGSRNVAQIPYENETWSFRKRFAVSGQGRDSECRVEFNIPANAEPTKQHWFYLGYPYDVVEWQKPGFRWELDVSTDAPGIGFRRTFHIEVVPAGKPT